MIIRLYYVFWSKRVGGIEMSDADIITIVKACEAIPQITELDLGISFITYRLQLYRRYRINCNSKTNRE